MADVDDQAERAIEHLRTLVAFNSISRFSNLPVQNWAAERFAALGATLRWTHDDERQKANLLATFGPAEAAGGIVLSGHTDVVDVAGQDWTEDPFALNLRGTRLFGRGACDMKGFLACSLAAIEAVPRERLARPIHLAWSYDEEVGCLGAPRMIEDLCAAYPTPALCVVGEPTSMRLVTAHNGGHAYTVTITGKEAHSSRPALGANAILAAGEFIVWLKGYFRALEHQVSRVATLDPPVTTFNVGMIEGGTAHNIVPRICRFGFGFRPIPEADAVQIERDVLAHLAEVIAPMVEGRGPGAGVVVTKRMTVPALAPTHNRSARDLLARSFGIDGDDAVPFGTEAGQFQALDIPTIVCGPGSIDQAHQADEYIEVEQMRAGTAFLTRLCTDALWR